VESVEEKVLESWKFYPSKWFSSKKCYALYLALPENYKKKEKKKKKKKKKKKF